MPYTLKHTAEELDRKLYLIDENKNRLPYPYEEAIPTGLEDVGDGSILTVDVTSSEKRALLNTCTLPAGKYIVSLDTTNIIDEITTAVANPGFSLEVAAAGATLVNTNNFVALELTDETAVAVYLNIPTAFDANILIKPQIEPGETKTAWVPYMGTVGSYVDERFNSTNAKIKAAVKALDDAKVNKVAGKDLSTNDYTNIEKIKLAGIEDGAEKNVQPDWNQSDETAADYVKNRTHYEENIHSTELIEEAYIHNSTYSDDTYTTFSMDTLQGNYIVGQTYMLEFISGSGSVLKTAYSECYSSMAGYCFGNKSILFGPGYEDGNDDSYCLLIENGELYWADFNSYPVAVRVYEEGSTYNLKQLDEKFIPDTIARVSDIPTLPEIPQQVNSDWNENDETKKSYIENRTHYEYTDTEEKAVVEWTSLQAESQQNYYFLNSIDVSNIDFDNTDLNLKVKFASSAGSITEYIGTVKHTSIGPVIGNQSIPMETFMGSGDYYCITADGSLYTIEPWVGIEVITDVETSAVKQLDEKFIPDTIARVDDINNVKKNLKNIFVQSEDPENPNQGDLWVKTHSPNFNWVDTNFTLDPCCGPSGYDYHILKTMTKEEYLFTNPEDAFTTIYQCPQCNSTYQINVEYTWNDSYWSCEYDAVKYYLYCADAENNTYAVSMEIMLNGEPVSGEYVNYKIYKLEEELDKTPINIYYYDTNKGWMLTDEHGINTSAIGEGASAFGIESIARGDATHAEGYQSSAGAKCFKFNLNHVYNDSDYDSVAGTGWYYLTSVDGLSDIITTSGNEEIYPVNSDIATYISTKLISFGQKENNGWSIDGLYDEHGDNIGEKLIYMGNEIEPYSELHINLYYDNSDNDSIERIRNDVLYSDSGASYMMLYLGSYLENDDAGSISMSFHDSNGNAGYGDGGNYFGDLNYTAVVVKPSEPQTTEYSMQLKNNYDFWGEIINVDDALNRIKVTNYKPVVAETGTEVSEDSFLLLPYYPNIGTDTLGISAHVEGYQSKALGMASHAEGYYTLAAGKYAHTEGRETKAGYGSHAEGRATTAKGENSHAEGRGSVASGMYSHAEGNHTKAFGNNSHAEGQNAEASGATSHAEGYKTIASNSYSHAEGNWTTAGGLSSHAEGDHAKAYADYSHAEGYYTKANGVYSHVEGEQSEANGQTSHAEGKLCIASGNYSHAEGKSCKASGIYSHSEGQNSVSAGNTSHAEGLSTSALGKYSHVEGSSSNLAITDYNDNSEIITAWNSKKFLAAYGNSAHAEGQNTLAIGDYSHSEGYRTQANGSQSHTEGQQTIANGTNSHAEGKFSIANGVNSHAEGNTQAEGDFQHTQGKYNIIDTEGRYAHIVGRGSASKRLNAHTVDWSGNAWYYGDVYVGGSHAYYENNGIVTDGKRLATEDFVEDFVRSLIGEVLNTEV